MGAVQYAPPAVAPLLGHPAFYFANCAISGTLDFARSCLGPIVPRYTSF